MKRAKEEMTKRVVFANEGDRLERVHQSMKAIEVRHVPVVRKGYVVGMLSDRDILLRSKLRADGSKQIPDVAVKEVMSSPVYTCRGDDSIGTVAQLMLDHKIDAVPVVDGEGKLQGIITSTDLLRLLRDSEWVPRGRFPFSFQPVDILEAQA